MRTYEVLKNPSPVIDWSSIVTNEIVDAVDRLIYEGNQDIDKIAAQDKDLSFENTILELDQAIEPLSFAYGILSHIESVAADEQFRSVFSQIEPKLIGFFSQIPLNQQLWKVIENFSKTPAGVSLLATKKRLFERRLTEFKREGATLSAADKLEFSQISVKLAQACTTFSRNVLDAMNSWELVVTDGNQLTGLPAHTLAMIAKEATDRGLKGYRLTLMPPCLIPALTFLENRSLRETLWRAAGLLGSKEPHRNQSLIKEILGLRRRKAQLLGYDNFASYVLEDRMAKDVPTVRSFIDRLASRVRNLAKSDYEQLLQFAQALGFKEVELAPWDIAFYAEKLRKERYSVDSENLRQYFPLDVVIAELFALAHDLFNIKLIPGTSPPNWGGDILSFDLIDCNNLQKLASVIFDLHPRKTKRPGAWMNPVYTGIPTSNGFSPHFIYIGANFTPPIAGKPSLLIHEEVKTLFHEFGHALHQALSTVEYKSLAGTNVLWDFVELPSMLMENWVWNKETLKRVSKHYLDGTPLSDEQIDQLISAKNYRIPSHLLRQLSFSALDIMLHVDLDINNCDEEGVVAAANKILQDYNLVRLPQSYSMITSFKHIFGDPLGYASGYYSYQWAEVLEADAFGRFKTEGTRNRTLGVEYREKILSKGNTEDPLVLFRSFMGRAPDEEALFRRMALAE